MGGPVTDTTRPHGPHPSGSPGIPRDRDAAATGPPDAAQPPKQRDPYFDNAKYLTILLVACGHAWEPLTYGSRSATALYLTVYAFHMPAFSLISGYFSRGFDLRPQKVKRLVSSVVVPYVIFEVAYSLFAKWMQHDPGYPISLLDPWFLMWFLATLFVWRLTTPLWKVIRWPVAVSLVVAALASISPETGEDLNLQRGLQLLPFFVLGLHMKQEHFQIIRRRETRIAAIPVLAVALALAYWAAPWLDAGWFYHRDTVQELGAPPGWGSSPLR